jgi:hypothetical protein
VKQRKDLIRRSKTTIFVIQHPRVSMTNKNSLTFLVESKYLEFAVRDSF